MTKTLGTIAVIIHEITNNTVLMDAINTAMKIISRCKMHPPLYNSVYQIVERTRITHAR